MIYLKAGPVANFSSFCSSKLVKSAQNLTRIVVNINFNEGSIHVERRGNALKLKAFDLQLKSKLPFLESILSTVLLKDFSSGELDDSVLFEEDNQMAARFVSKALQREKSKAKFAIQGSNISLREGAILCCETPPLEGRGEILLKASSLEELKENCLGLLNESSFKILKIFLESLEGEKHCFTIEHLSDQQKHYVILECQFPEEELKQLKIRASALGITLDSSFS